MSIGMLWFDNDPKASLEEKIRKAAAYYREKYGGEPNMCFVSPKLGIDAGRVIGGLVVKPSKQVHANHLWIGIDESLEACNAN